MRGFENRYELAHLISCRLMGTITPEEIRELASRHLCKETLKEVVSGKKMS